MKEVSSIPGLDWVTMWHPLLCIVVSPKFGRVWVNQWISFFGVQALEEFLTRQGRGLRAREARENWERNREMNLLTFL